MDLTWSKFIKFCRENGLIEEDAHPCKIKPAPSTDAAATAADPAAASPAANFDCLGERGGCRRIDPRELDRTHPTLTIGPLLPCGMRHCRAFGLCARCARNPRRWL